MSKSLGPWTTSINSGATLSAFWKQRVTRLPELIHTSSRLSGRSAIVLALAAVLAFGWPTVRLSLEVVAADSPSTSKTNSSAVEKPPGHEHVFAVNLDDGVRVELLGICEHPSQGNAWWAADGQPIAAPYQSLLARAGTLRPVREIAVLWSVPENRAIATHWYVKKCAVWVGGTTKNVAGAGPRDLRRGIFHAGAR